MTAVQHAWQRARRRQWWITFTLLLPVAIGIAALSIRLAGVNVGTAVLLPLLLGAVGTATWRTRRLDRAWLVRQLDTHRVAQDSADLLFAETSTLNPLQQRQRARTDAALAQAMPDLRRRWPRRALAMSWVGGGLAVLLAVAWPAPEAPRTTRTAGATSAAGVVSPPRLQSSRLQVRAPSYTGQAVRTQTALDAKVVQGSTLDWSLRFSAPPARAALQLHDGTRIPLRREGDAWVAQWQARRPTLYRVVTEPALAASRLHRLDVIADQPPRVRVIAPDRTLVLATAAQKQWSLQFEASDDFGVAASAELHLTLAQGSGENITFKEHRIVLAGSGPATQRRFAHTLDLGVLGAGPGNDVIAQLHVRDNRSPQAQTAQSTSLILRLPSEEQVLGEAMEGMVKKTLPAYFRSQRQIIIDAEALIKLRRSLPPDEFVKRSDAIGVDQRILRLRYGQFLGEESEGAPKAPPTSDSLPTSDAPANDHAGDDHDDHDHAQAGHDDHGHDHGTAKADAAPVFGAATDVLSEYGHTHDHAEAATLLDPQTRATLKAALDQMWSSEGELRQGRPEKALPFAYKALDFIKQVQQAERIYLARVGPELPPIDEGRRMSGVRDDLASRTLPLAPVDAPDPAIVAVWQQLADVDTAPDLDALTRWLDRHQSRLADPLSLAAAVEELRVAPDCRDCRATLRAQLWRALLRPLPQVARRSAPDPMAQRYLDALEGAR